LWNLFFIDILVPKNELNIRELGKGSSVAINLISSLGSNFIHDFSLVNCGMNICK